MTDLSRLGLDPAPDHPDSEIHELLGRARRQAGAWSALRDLEAASDYVRTQRLLARSRPETLLGLLELADFALEPWRIAGREQQSIFALQAAVLEQVVEVLSLFTEEEIAVKRGAP